MSTMNGMKWQSKTRIAGILALLLLVYVVIGGVVGTCLMLRGSRAGSLAGTKLEVARALQRMGMDLMTYASINEDPCFRDLRVGNEEVGPFDETALWNAMSRPHVGGSDICVRYYLVYAYRRRQDGKWMGTKVNTQPRLPLLLGEVYHLGEGHLGEISICYSDGSVGPGTVPCDALRSTNRCEVVRMPEDGERNPFSEVVSDIGIQKLTRIAREP